MSRYHNIELLRILSMLLIVMHHYSVHGGFVLDPNVISINKVIVQFLSSGGKIGVNCFVLITGYFMVKSTFKFDKLLKLLFTVFTYSAPIYIIALSTGFIDFNIKQAMKSFFPILFNHYWFATNYVLLYIFSSYINSFLNTIGHRKHLYLILLLTTIWSLLPTIVLAKLSFSLIGWFITLYIIGSYIRLYPNNLFDSIRVNKLLFLSSFIFILLSILLFDFLGLSIPPLAERATFFIAMNKFPLLLCSITLFLWFKNMTINSNKYINIIASSMFGVYLIHDNNVVRPLLWIDIFKNKSFFYSDYLIIHATISILLVFLCCIILDQIKKHLLEIPLSRKIDLFSKNILIKLEQLQPKMQVWANKSFHRTH